MSLIPASSIKGGNLPENAQLGSCTFNVDTVTGRCRAEFQAVHVEKLQPSRRAVGKNDSGERGKLEKHALLFETVVHVCGCNIPLQV